MERESVWDYPRPPLLESFFELVEITIAGTKIVQSARSKRVLETSHPPVFYIPQSDIAMQYLTLTDRSSVCEWKGRASYWDLNVDLHKVQNAAWSYGEPTSPFISIKDYLAFYASDIVLCSVNGEMVRPQPGNFYGGWITDNIIGPFKGGPNSGGW